MRGIIYLGQSRPSKAPTYLQGKKNSSQMPVSTGIESQSNLPNSLMTMSLVDISAFCIELTFSVPTHCSSTCALLMSKLLVELSL